MAYKYNKTIMNGAETLIDGIENIEMFLGDDDNWNFHDSEIDSFHWDKEKNTFSVTVNLIGCEFPEIEGWDGESDVVLDFHFEDCIEVHMNHVDFSFPNYIYEIEISKCRDMMECWFNGYSICVTSSRLRVDKPRILENHKTGLKAQIKAFYASKAELTERMRNLAKIFLFGGYINVRNEYHIYLKTVEFYYHEEEGNEKDVIMYHRNNYLVGGNIPYFKPLTFNSHDTGVDITFENEEKKIRASVLIRAYEVLDIKTGNRMVWNTQDQQFQPYKKGTKYNTQSMYIKKFLNGFSSSGTPDIYWVDVPYSKPISLEDISQKVRQGVFESSDKERYISKKGQTDGKEWAFRREKDIDLK